MGVILDRLAGWMGYSRVGNREVWHEVAAYGSWAGPRITPEQALRVSTVMACVKVIAEDLASLPLKVYRLLPGGGKEQATTHRLWYLLHNAPNAWQTSMEFREVMQGHVLLRGNAYAKIVPDERDTPVALEPIHPDTVRIERDATTKRLVYIVQDPVTLTERTFDQQDILHLRGFGLDGVKGLSPIGYAADSIGISLATEQFQGSFYRNGAHIGLHLEHPNTLSDKSLDNLKKQIADGYSGSPRAFRTLITQEGMKASRLGVDPKEAEFIDSRKFSVQDLCRIFRVPAFKVGDQEHSKYNNVEQLQIDYVTSCLRAWVVRWEQALERDLFMRDEGHVAMFTMEGLLRGDVKTRTEALAIQKLNGVLSRNEWRQIEDRNPVAGGDEFTEAANLMGNRGGDGSVRPTQRDEAAMAEAWAKDIAGRIAGAELRAVTRWRSTTGLMSWADWVKDVYCGKHREYMDKALAPLLDAGRRSDCLAELGSQGMCVADMSPDDAMAFLRDERPEQIYETIMREVNHG
jgi:HK97 family phage portal protein